jgi:hypothetical protein
MDRVHDREVAVVVQVALMVSVRQAAQAARQVAAVPVAVVALTTALMAAPLERAPLVEQVAITAAGPDLARAVRQALREPQERMAAVAAAQADR